MKKLSKKLIDAAKRGRLKMVKYLLDDHAADVNATDTHGRTALAYASGKGNMDMVRFLVEHGANINVIDALGKTALSLASDQYHRNVTDFLVAHGVNPGIPDLIYVIKNNIHMEEKLIKAYANIVDNEGETLLMHASVKGSVDLVEDLIDIGKADVNAVDQYQRTALIHAAFHGRLKIVKYLIEHGADLNLEDDDGRTALAKALVFKNLETARCLIEHGAQQTPDREGHTPLHMAALRGHLPSVKLLLDSGADVNFANHQGDTPLMVASYPKVVEFLLDHGADAKMKNQLGMTALAFAARRGQAESVVLLLQKVEEIPLNLLRLMAEQGHCSIANRLIERGLGVDSADEDRKTALMFAAEGGHLKMVKLLVKSGANVNATTRYSDTVFDFAIESGNVEVAKYLDGLGQAV